MYVLKAAKVLTGRPHQSIPHCAVLVDAGKIIDIKSQNEIQIPPHAKVMDFKQCTLLPGLIDSHVHLVMDASADPVANLEMTAEELLQRMQANAKTLLESRRYHRPAFGWNPISGYRAQDSRNRKRHGSGTQCAGLR